MTEFRFSSLSINAILVFPSLMTCFAVLRKPTDCRMALPLLSGMTEIGELQRHPHAVLASRRASGHQLPRAPSQHIERECLLDCARVDGHDATGYIALTTSLLFAIKIIREGRSCIFFFPAVHLCLRLPTGPLARSTRFCRVVFGIGLAYHPSNSRYGLARPIAPILPFSIAPFMAKYLSQSSCVRNRSLWTLRLSA